ncbi:MAG: BPL-N domain-containing protein [Candidatus Thorarchaeota archaeon]|nr:BPL-N domain-containing protein [Candidatus Thorarchaeota archaeon]
MAVYTGSQVLSHSFTALQNMFEWMNASAEAISASRIKDGWLDNYDILVFPGRPQSSYSSELEDEGKEIIIDFVENGGSYFGVCGGANFGAGSLHFLDGSIRSAYEMGEEQHLTIMHLVSIGIISGSAIALVVVLVVLFKWKRG